MRTCSLTMGLCITLARTLRRLRWGMPIVKFSHPSSAAVSIMALKPGIIASKPRV